MASKVFETLGKFLARLNQEAGLALFGKDCAVIERMQAKISQSSKGAEAIYQEKGILDRVRVHRISPGLGGVDVELEFLNTPGLWGMPETVTVGSSWEFVQATDSLLKGAYYPWTIYFDPSVVREVTHIAATWRGPEIEIYYKLTELLTDVYCRSCQASG